MMIILHNQLHALAVNNIFVPCAMQSGVKQGFVRPNKNTLNFCQRIVFLGNRIVENNHHMD